MLTSVRFENLKALRDVTIPLQPLTVLVGPNGVGKSTVLDGIAHVLNFLNIEPRVNMSYQHGVVGHYMLDAMDKKEITHNKNTVSISITTFENTGFGFSFSESGSIVKNNGSTHVSNIKSNQLYDYISKINISKNFIRLKLDPDKIIQPSKNMIGVPELKVDGSGLPTLLNHIIVQRNKIIEKIELAISKIVSQFNQIYVDNTTISSEINNTIISEVGFTFSADINGGRVPAKHMSEGTLLLIAICTLLHSPKCPRLLLIDDIDRGLHPRAQMELIALLRKLIQQQPDLQIIATSHSDTILNGCAPEEVVRLDFGPDGGAVVVPTTGDPRYMTPSEISYEWFGITRTGMDDLIQQYALLAGDVLRSEEEDRQLQKLAEELQRMNAKGLPPIRPRRA